MEKSGSSRLVNFLQGSLASIKRKSIIAYPGISPLSEIPRVSLGTSLGPLLHSTLDCLVDENTSAYYYPSG